jgi:hypothetical protein
MMNETTPTSEAAPCMLDTAELRDIYQRLWTWTSSIPGDTKPPVPALYDGGLRIRNGAVALFALTLGKRDFPRVWVLRVPCPARCTEPNLDGATLPELISLAHERGHERSWREGTYPGRMTMPEEHRAWDHAERLLRSMGFVDWDRFESQRERSLAEHRRRGTPETEDSRHSNPCAPATAMEVVLATGRSRDHRGPSLPPPCREFLAHPEVPAWDAELRLSVLGGAMAGARELPDHGNVCDAILTVVPHGVAPRRHYGHAAIRDGAHAVGHRGRVRG